MKASMGAVGEKFLSADECAFFRLGKQELIQLCVEECLKQLLPPAEVVANNLGQEDHLRIRITIDQMVPDDGD